MSNVQKMLDSTRAANAVDFGKAFYSEMMSRIGDQISLARQSTVAGMFGGTVHESEEKMCKCGKMLAGKCSCDKKMNESAYDKKIAAMHPVDDHPDFTEEPENFEIPLELEAAVRGSMQTNRRDPMQVVKEPK